MEGSSGVRHEPLVSQGVTPEREWGTSGGNNVSPESIGEIGCAHLRIQEISFEGNILLTC